MILRLAGVGVLLAILWLASDRSPAGAGACTGDHLVWTFRRPVVERPLAAPEGPRCRLDGKLTFSRRRPAGPIVVYLENAGGEYKFSPPQDPFEISQQRAQFHPDFAAVVRGRPVVFNNDESDEIDHNVYFTGSDKSDLGIFPRKATRTHVFRDIGEVRVFCSVHSQMDGKIFVAPNPHFTVVGPDTDAFVIEGVPPGKWILKTWQKIRRFHDPEIPITLTVPGSEGMTVEMTR